LISGKPGSGKTALARGIGYDFTRESPQNTVFYLSVDRKPSSNEWLKQIKQSDHLYVLYIIDDCHNAIDDVNDFIERWYGIKNAKVLLISRSIHPDLAGTLEEHNNYIIALKSETVPLNVERETIFQIVQHLEKRKNTENKEIGDTEVVLKKCEGDLHLLNFYVEAWLEKKEIKNLSDVAEQTVLDNVYRLYLKDKKYTEQLLSIAAMSQFEIPVEGRWIGNLEVIDSILKNAWVEKLEDTSVTPIVFLKYFHSTPASYFLKAAFKKAVMDKRFDSLDRFIMEKLENYLSYKPFNFFDVFVQLYKNERKDLQNELFQKQNTFKLYKEIISKNQLINFNDQLINISKFLRAVWIWEKKKKKGMAYKLLKFLRNNIEERKEFSKNVAPKGIVSTSSWLNGIDSKLTKEILLSWDLKTFCDQLKDFGLPTITRFIHLISQTVIEKTDLKVLCDGLDFKLLGERSRDVGLATVMRFLQLTSRAGVEKTRVNAFCDGLDFKELGKRSQDVGLATVKTFLQLTSRVGVENQNLNVFCDGLDFKLLGERSRDVGLSTVMTFLQLTSRAGVEKDILNAFCDGLDFKLLGERSRDVGLATVMRFLQLTSRAGVENQNLNVFCSVLNWKKLGQSSTYKEGGLKNLLFPFHLLLKAQFITKEMALQFVEGIGWEKLSKEIEENLSPDTLSVTKFLLMRKCNLGPVELNKRKIDLRPNIIWFRAFTNNPCPNIEEGQKKWRANYLKDAFNRLLSQNLEDLLRKQMMDLRAWNIFIHNIILSDPSYIDKIIVPIFRSFSIKQYEKLFYQSDLKNIGIFLSHFNPHDGLFKWTPPKGITFQKLDFMNKFEQSPIDEIAHFLFSFYFVERPDLCNYFAELLEMHPKQLLAKIEVTEINQLGFFLWNLWMALPVGVKPSLLKDISFKEILIKKATLEKEDQENILELVGILKLSYSEIPTKLMVLIRPDDAKQLCHKAVKAGSFKSMRLLGGLSTIFPDLPFCEKKDYLIVLEKIFNDINVPNMNYALNRLREWLEREENTDANRTN
jgi:hypothetical protein